MELPDELQNAVEKAYSALNHKPGTWISPYYRKNIYNILNSIDENIGYKASAWLSILAARYSLAKWQESCNNIEWKSEKDKPEYYLYLAKRVLAETLDPSKVINRLDAFEQATKTIYNGDWDRYYISIMAQACFVALRVSLGKDSFLDIELTKKTIDPNGYEVLRPNPYWDTAFYAASAYSLNFQDHNETVAHEFWEWWLTEAIPQAWDLARRSI